MTFRIGKVKFSKSTPTVIIPEIGINHFGSLKIAKKIVDNAIKAGAKIIKTQTHIPDKEMSSEARFIKPGNSNLNIYAIIKNNSLSLSNEQKLKNYIESKGCEYLSTPFCIEAAEFLNEIGVKAFKIGSGEFNNLPLIEKICSFKKPIILSTGMNPQNSILKTVKFLKKYNAKFLLNYCVNLYPTPLKLINLKEINFLKKIGYKNLIGYSDHSKGLSASISSIFQGSLAIEKHFCLSKKRNGPDIECSMDQIELSYLIKYSKEIFTLYNNKKNSLNKQKITSNFAFHSLVATQDLPKGKIINKEDINIKRPGTGDFKANDFKNLINKRLKLKIKQNTQFKYEHFK